MQETCLCHMQTTKTQISLHIGTVWSAPLLFANTYTCWLNFSRLAGLHSRANWFESYLVVNPKERFSRDVAHYLSYSWWWCCRNWVWSSTEQQGTSTCWLWGHGWCRGWGRWYYPRNRWWRWGTTTAICWWRWNKFNSIWKINIVLLHELP